MKKLMQEYFQFTRKDRIGMVSLVLLLVIVFFLPAIRSIFSPRLTQIRDTIWVGAEGGSNSEIFPENSEFAKMELIPHGRREAKNAVAPPTSQLFDFDPNKLDERGWKKLGFSDRTIQTIRHYLEKGGKFRERTDLQKIYGIRTDQYERVAGHIRLRSDGVNQQAEGLANKFPAMSGPKPSYYRKPAIIDINQADTTAFIALPGIGSKLASRIIYFRERLGGFYALNQISEVYGLADSTFEKLKPYLVLESKTIRPVLINTASRDDLRSHPYIKWNIATAIIEYRNQHGSYSSIEELKKIPAIDAATFEKLSHYVEL